MVLTPLNVMAGMRRANAGLVLSPQAVEAVAVGGGPTGAAAVRTARVEATASSDEGMAQAIRAALERAAVTAKRLPVAVPSEDVLLRFFTLPLLPKAEWRTAVQFEVRKYIPFRVEELVWTFHAVEDKSSRQLRVVFFGIRTDQLQRLQQRLAAAGVQPACLEPYPLTLARLAPATPRGAEPGFTAIVEVQAQNAHLVIAQNRMPYFARDINLRTEPKAERLLSELRLSLDFFARTQPGAAVHQVLVFGDETAVGPWCATWASQLGCPVELGRPPMPSVSDEPLAAAHAGAVSLALRDARTAGSLDFLAAATGKAAGKPAAALKLSLSEADLIPLLKAMARPAAWQATVAAVLLVGFAVVTHQRVAAERQRLAHALQRLPDVGWQLKGRPMTELESLRGQADQRLAALRTLVEQRVSVTKKLEGLTRVLPEGVWLEGLTYQDVLTPDPGLSRASLVLRGACYLSGAGSELETISDFAQRLKQEPALFQGFSTATLGEVAQSTDYTQQHSFWRFRLISEAEPRAF
jgi:hypothetical protein